MEYDIIILGAGPAGMACAATLGNSPYKVAVIDRSYHHLKRFDVRGTAREVMTEMAIDEAIISEQSRFMMCSRKESALFTYPQQKFCTINMQKLLQILKKRSNAQFLTAEIVNVERVDGGIRLTDSVHKTYTTRLLIDCSGNAFVATQSLGLRTPQVLYHCAAMILDDCDIPADKQDEMAFYMDTSVCNSAVWFYPLGGRRCQFGLGEMAPYKMSSSEQLRIQLLNARNLPQFRKMLQDSRVDEKLVTFGHNPVIQPLEHMQVDNIMFVGDAAGMATPLVGDGVRPALIGGRNAALVAAQSLAKGDLSAASLQDHERWWWQRFGHYYIWTMLMRHAVCEDFTPEDWDEVVRRLQHVDKEIFWDVICSRMTLETFYQLMDFKIVRSVVVDEAKRHLPHLFSMSRRYETSHLL